MMFGYMYLMSVFTLQIPIFILGLFMPVFARKNLLFGVTVPEDIHEQPIVKNLKKSYRRNYLGSFLISVGIIHILAYFTRNAIFMNVGSIFLILVFTANYVHIHHITKKLKQEKGWTENKKQMVIVDTSTNKGMGTNLDKWFLIPVFIILLTIIITIRQYTLLPERIPRHFNLRGDITGFSNKGFFALAGLPLTQMSITVMFYVIYKIMNQAKNIISSAKPKASVIQNQIAKYRWGVFLIVTGILLNLQYLYIQLKVLQLITISRTMHILVSILIGIIIFGGAIGLSFTTGQSGSRIRVKGEEEENNGVINRDDDAYWKWGLFYNNPDDPSLMIEKRFGIGWTINFGQPIGKISMLLIISVIIISIIKNHFL